MRAAHLTKDNAFKINTHLSRTNLREIEANYQLRAPKKTSTVMLLTCQDKP